MCLLIAMSGVVADAPLIVAANRDERLDRPAVPMTVLREHGPRILGGRDELAGGTWLAVNEYGVVAGLTNQPSANGRDPTKRSRGELPLAFAGYATAAEAVAAVAETLDAAAYNPCWMLVGDRTHAVLHRDNRPRQAGGRAARPGVVRAGECTAAAEVAKAEFVTELVGRRLNGSPTAAQPALWLRWRPCSATTGRRSESANGRSWPGLAARGDGGLRPCRGLRHKIRDDRERAGPRPAVSPGGGGTSLRA